MGTAVPAEAASFYLHMSPPPPPPPPPSFFPCTPGARADRSSRQHQQSPVESRESPRQCQRRPCSRKSKVSSNLSQPQPCTSMWKRLSSGHRVQLSSAQPPLIPFLLPSPLQSLRRSCGQPWGALASFNADERAILLKVLPRIVSLSCLLHELRPPATHGSGCHWD